MLSRMSGEFVCPYRTQLTQETGYHLCRNHSGKFLVQSLKLESKLLVIDTQQMKQRGVEIAHVHRIANGVVAVLVRLTVGNSPVRAAARQPNGEAARMMIPPVVGFGKAALTVNRAPELPAPDHERIVQHATSLQIGHEGIAGTIRCQAQFG